MICELFMKMRLYDEYSDQPACGVVQLTEQLVALLATVDMSGLVVRRAGGFSASWLCPFTVYSHDHVPVGYWQGVINELEKEPAIPVWSTSAVDWGDPLPIDVCKVISYGEDGLVFQCQDKYGTGNIESDFISLSDIQRWAQPQS